jgi:hypothetical protein
MRSVRMVFAAYLAVVLIGTVYVVVLGWLGR